MTGVKVVNPPPLVNAPVMFPPSSISTASISPVSILARNLAQHGDEQQDHHQDDDPESHVLVKLLIHPRPQTRFWL